MIQPGKPEEPARIWPQPRPFAREYAVVPADPLIRIEKKPISFVSENDRHVQSYLVVRKKSSILDQYVQMDRLRIWSIAITDHSVLS